MKQIKCTIKTLLLIFFLTNSTSAQKINPLQKKTAYQVVKRYCDEGNNWYYLVTIQGDKIKLECFPGANNNIHKNKKKPMETIIGLFKYGKIITKDPPEYGTNRYRFENGRLFEINNEGGDNDYIECN